MEIWSVHYSLFLIKVYLSLLLDKCMYAKKLLPCKYIPCKYKSFRFSLPVTDLCKKIKQQILQFYNLSVTYIFLCILCPSACKCLKYIIWTWKLTYSMTFSLFSEDGNIETQKSDGRKITHDPSSLHLLQYIISFVFSS